MNTKKSHKVYNVALFLGVASLIFLLIISHVLSISTFFYSLLAAFGLYLNYLILKKKIGFKSGNLDRLCSVTTKNSCSSIFNNDRDQFFLNISFSDLSVIYFTFSAILSFFIYQLGLSNSLFIFTALSTPIIIYSIYYQLFRLKELCLICMTMNFFIILQTILLASINYSSFKYNAQALLIFGLLFIIIFSLWMMFKEKITFFQDAYASYLDFHQLIRKKNIYNTHQQKHNSDKFNLVGLTTISIVDITENIANEIYLVVSPNCAGCSLAYKDLKKLLSYYPNEVNANLIFDLRIISDEVKNVFSRMIELSLFRDPHLEVALDEWFLKKVSPKMWLKKWGEVKDLYLDVYRVIKNLSKFLDTNNINYTPVIIFNELEVSNFYRIKDLIYFMNEAI